MSSDLNKAVDILKNDGIVGMPTETVYGLAGRIDSSIAINKIFTTKKRPFFDPLIVHVSSIDQAKSLSNKWNQASELLAKSFWPGPLTLILEKNESVSDLITSGLDSVGIRMPNHPTALELIKLVGTPLAAPSANRFGKTSPTTAEHVQEEFENKILVLDGGACEVGLESTILKINESDLDFYEIQILREGRISIDDIVKVLNQNHIKWKVTEKINKLEAPGQMKHHYMPNKPLIVTSENVEIEKIYQEINLKLQKLPDMVEGVEIIKPKITQSHFELKLSNEPHIAFREFYALLRLAAKSDSDFILFKKPDYFNNPVWEPLNNRLQKAASLII